MNSSYAAGFFDAEGCLSVSNGSIRVSIGQAEPQVLFLLKKQWNGQIIGHEPYASASQKKFVWMWAIDRQSDVVAFLKAIQQYCIVKRNQVDAVLQSMSQKIERGKTVATRNVLKEALLVEKKRTVPPESLTDEELALVNRIYRLKIANNADQS